MQYDPTRLSYSLCLPSAFAWDDACNAHHGLRVLDTCSRPRTREQMTRAASPLVAKASHYTSPTPSQLQALRRPARLPGVEEHDASTPVNDRLVVNYPCPSRPSRPSCPRSSPVLHTLSTRLSLLHSLAVLFPSLALPSSLSHTVPAAHPLLVSLSLPPSPSPVPMLLRSRSSGSHSLRPPPSISLYCTLFPAALHRGFPLPPSFPFLPPSPPSLRPLIPLLPLPPSTSHRRCPEKPTVGEGRASKTRIRIRMPRRRREHGAYRAADGSYLPSPSSCARAGATRGRGRGRGSRLCARGDGVARM
ncbi:hypothetical protein C8R47DRAFT_1154152 [Mycena vitilis]|nr:hypothetical protein C8R47DRAFT_1154152 [Mycena vitilis]